MMNSVKKKHSGLFKVIIVCSSFVFVFILLSLSAVITDEEYLLFIKKRYSLNEVKYSIKEIKSDGYNAESGGTTPATNGKGLNLMLIDEMDSSYAKDLLTCMRKSANGDYDAEGTHDIRLTVNVSCGLSNAETSTYDGYLLQSYLPYENGHVIWNEPHGMAKAEEMTLEKFDYTVAAKAGHYPISGPAVTSFQYDHWETRAVKASINGSGNAGRTTGDMYYYPDVLETNNAYMTGFVRNIMGLSDIEQEELSETWLAFMYAMAHNRGEGGALNYMYGCKFSVLDRYKNTSRVSNEELLDMSNSTVALYTDYRAKYPDAYDIANFNIDSGSVTIPAALLAVWNEDWYISEVMGNYLITAIDASVNYWNALFPNEQLTAEELKKKINSSVATYSEAIKKSTGKNVTAEECLSVYGANNADNLDVWNITDLRYNVEYTGVIFKVTDVQSAAYKNKYSDGADPYVIHAMDVICAREAFSSCLGDIIYARLLAYAGLANVDPTNPDTYYLGANSLVPTGDMAWMSAYGIDTSKLTVNRANLLQTGYNITQLEECSYCHWEDPAQFSAMNREFYDDLTPTELECATFVCRVIRDTGFSKFDDRTSCGPILRNENNAWEYISPEELQPGDVMIYVNGKNGHVMFYLSGDARAGQPLVCTVMESNAIANPHFDRDGPLIRTTWGSHRFATGTTPAEDGTYYCLRLKEIDTAVTAERTYEE